MSNIKALLIEIKTVTSFKESSIENSQTASSEALSFYTLLSTLEMDSKSFDPNDPERNRKRIENVGVVLNRIQKNLVTKTREIVKEETKEEQIEKLLVSEKFIPSTRNFFRQTIFLESSKRRSCWSQPSGGIQ